MSHEYEALVMHIAKRLDELSTQEDISPFHAWPRVVAELLGYDRTTIELLDRNDSGVDFFFSDSPVYEIYQCKMHDLTESGDVDPTAAFDSVGVVDLDRACTMLFGGQAAPSTDPRLLGLRARMQEELQLLPTDPEEAEAQGGISVVFNLVVLGSRLAPIADAAVVNFKDRLRKLDESRPGLHVRFELWTLKDLAAFFEDAAEKVSRKPEPMRVHVALKPLHFSSPEQGQIAAAELVTFYAPASDLVAASLKSGPSLFDANVRYELKKSKINEEIRRSATHAKTMKLFHLYNNGVTIAAEGWTFEDNRRVIQIRAPSVINGCQTIRSLVAARKQLDEAGDPYPLSMFNEDCMVLVRLIRRHGLNIDEVVQAANTQNAMEDRNLLSNRTEQRQMERLFEEWGWFYERKDGAEDALIEAGRNTTGTPVSEFTAPRAGPGRRLIRSCDNRDVAKAWLSFIGFSDEGQNQRKRHFVDTSAGLYRKVFQRRPLLHWDVAALGGDTLEEHVSVSGLPSAAWMLYAHHLYVLVRHLLPSASRLRANVRRSILASNQPPTIATVNERIMASDDLRIQFALSMLDHVLVELVGFCLARALGTNWQSDSAARKALETGTIGHFNVHGQLPTGLTEGGLLALDESAIAADPALVAFRLAARGIQGVLAKPEFSESFRASERKSRYLQQEQQLREYARMVDSYNKYLGQAANFEPWWHRGEPYVAIRSLLIA